MRRLWDHNSLLLMMKMIISSLRRMIISLSNNFQNEFMKIRGEQNMKNSNKPKQTQHVRERERDKALKTN